jgi:hypothetical protein
MPELSGTANGAEIAVQFTNWQLRRRVNRSIIRYRKGGGKSRVLGSDLLIAVAADHMNAASRTDYLKLINAARQGQSVTVTALGLDYFDDDLLGDGVAVDIDSEEFIESAGDFFEYAPMRLEMASASPISEFINFEKDELLWGDTEHTFDDVGEDTFDKYN